jgi:hypothetical protein
VIAISPTCRSCVVVTSNSRTSPSLNPTAIWYPVGLKAAQVARHGADVTLPSVAMEWLPLPNSKICWCVVPSHTRTLPSVDVVTYSGLHNTSKIPAAAAAAAAAATAQLVSCY